MRLHRSDKGKREDRTCKGPIKVRELHNPIKLCHQPLKYVRRRSHSLQLEPWAAVALEGG